MGSINAKFFMMCLVYLIGFSLLVSFILAEMSMGSFASISVANAPTPTGNAALDSLNFAGYILTLMGSIILWTLPEEIFPLWANLLFVKSVVIALIVQIIGLVWI